MKRPDRRLAQAKRNHALARVELKDAPQPKPTPLTDAELAAAIAAGKLRRIPAKRR
jgi:hypothetical protein